MRRTRSGRVTAIILALAAVTVLGVVPAAAAEPDPILLVHGYRGSPSTWGDMIARFAAKGRTAVAIDLASENNVTNANAIGSFIAARGWKRVDIVGQSMGGLSARWFVKFGWTNATIDSYVSIGTPQYGIWSRVCPAALVRRADVSDERVPERPQPRRRHARERPPGRRSTAHRTGSFRPRRLALTAAPATSA